MGVPLTSITRERRRFHGTASFEFRQIRTEETYEDYEAPRIKLFVPRGTSDKSSPAAVKDSGVDQRGSISEARISSASRPLAFPRNEFLRLSYKKVHEKKGTINFNLISESDLSGEPTTLLE